MGPEPAQGIELGIGGGDLGQHVRGVVALPLHGFLQCHQPGPNGEDVGLDVLQGIDLWSPVFLARVSIGPIRDLEREAINMRYYLFALFLFVAFGTTLPVQAQTPPQGLTSFEWDITGSPVDPGTKVGIVPAIEIAAGTRNEVVQFTLTVEGHSSQTVAYTYPPGFKGAVEVTAIDTTGMNPGTYQTFLQARDQHGHNITKWGLLVIGAGGATGGGAPPTGAGTGQPGAGGTSPPGTGANLVTYAGTWRNADVIIVIDFSSGRGVLHSAEVVVNGEHRDASAGLSGSAMEFLARGISGARGATLGRGDFVGGGPPVQDRPSVLVSLSAEDPIGSPRVTIPPETVTLNRRP